ncbi:DUF2292 domain-containing protein [Candidatus Woesebacteria bacterium]|nr:MAG: DUF2292 domain-containing protein [Candidatus Woesebacteria bacterium]
MTVDYSTKKVSKSLLSEIKTALEKAGGFGSVEIYIQNNIVTQITTRNIRKTSKISGKSL